MVGFWVGSNPSHLQLLPDLIPHMPIIRVEVMGLILESIHIIQTMLFLPNLVSLLAFRALEIQDFGIGH
jgi:hypothetical protein